MRVVRRRVLPAQEDLPALQAVKARRVMNKHIDKYLFFIINLNFQLHLPDGFQQRPALFEARFAQVAQA